MFLLPFRYILYHLPLIHYILIKGGEIMLGETLVKLRLNLSLSQNLVAEKLNVSAATYNRYEKNQRSPDNATLVLLADFYNVSIDFLLGRSDKVYSTQATYMTDFEKQLIESTSNFTKTEQDKVLEYITFISSQKQLNK